jgi:catalase
VEQAAFSSVNTVPGTGNSPDKMLQARLISYPDGTGRRFVPPDDAARKRRLIQNIANHMRGIPKRIIKLQIGHFANADSAYGRGVAEALAWP